MSDLPRSSKTIGLRSLKRQDLTYIPTDSDTNNSGESVILGFAAIICPVSTGLNQDILLAPSLIITG